MLKNISLKPSVLAMGQVGLFSASTVIPITRPETRLAFVYWAHQIRNEVRF
jgi:hypothetical protein